MKTFKECTSEQMEHYSKYVRDNDNIYYWITSAGNIIAVESDGNEVYDWKFNDLEEMIAFYDCIGDADTSILKQMTLF